MYLPSPPSLVMPENDPDIHPFFKLTYAGLYGAELIAILLNVFVYGVAFTMILQYFKRHAKQDSIVQKITMFVLILLATLETTFCCHQLYADFIERNGNTEKIDKIGFSVPAKFACTYLTAFVAQIFFSSRIWSVGKHLNSRLRFLIIPIGLTALLQISAGLGVASLMAISKTFSTLTYKTSELIKLTTLQGVATAVCDVIITTSLCCVFHSHRSGIKKSNSVINWLIIYAINRAIATSICALLTAFSFYFLSGTYYFLIPLLVNTHLYVISAVSILTSREGLREKINHSIHLSDMQMGSTGSAGMEGENMRNVPRFDFLQDKSPQAV